MANSCHVLQSLIFMMLGHMGETDTDGDQCISWYSSTLVTAHECYNVVFKALIYLDILYTPICIMLHHSAHIFKGSEYWGGA